MSEFSPSNGRREGGEGISTSEGSKSGAGGGSDGGGWKVALSGDPGVGQKLPTRTLSLRTPSLGSSATSAVSATATATAKSPTALYKSYPGPPTPTHALPLGKIQTPTAAAATRIGLPISPNTPSGSGSGSQKTSPSNSYQHQYPQQPQLYHPPSQLSAISTKANSSTAAISPGNTPTNQQQQKEQQQQQRQNSNSHSHSQHSVDRRFSGEIRTSSTTTPTSFAGGGGSGGSGRAGYISQQFQGMCMSMSMGGFKFGTNSPKEKVLSSSSLQLEEQQDTATVEVEQVPTPVNPVVSGIRHLRKSLQKGDLGGFGEAPESTPIVRVSKPMQTARSNTSEDRAKRVDEWQKLRFILRLQRAVRIRLSKRKTLDLNQQRKLEMQRLYEDSNAVTIQHLWRMYAAKLQLERLRQQKQQQLEGKLKQKIDL